MKTLVINLDLEKDRMNFQRKQLGNLGVEFERLSAVRIESKDELSYQTLSQTWERPLRISEVSCFLSHKRAWSKVIDYQQPMLILEDDAYLASNISCVLQELERLGDLDYVCLEVRGEKQKKLVAQKVRKFFCESSLFRLYQGRSGAAAYVLWPSGAKILMEGTGKGSKAGLADKFINATYLLRAYQLEPAIAIQLDQCHFHQISPPIDVSSSISSISVPKERNVLRYFIFKGRRVLGELKILFNYLKYRKVAIKREVQLSRRFSQ